MTNKEKLLQFAHSMVGYVASKDKHNKFAADIDKNHPNFYNGKKDGYNWCDVFVDDCFIQVFGEANALKLLCQPTKSCGAGCGWSMKYYQNKKQFYSKPEVGDQIFFKNGSSIVHTGIVYKIDKSKVYTIEGNASNSVAYRSYLLGSKTIAGYGRPKYDSIKMEATPTKTIEDMAREVIAGKWGNGVSRKNDLEKAGWSYKAIQTVVNRMLLKK